MSIKLWLDGDGFLAMYFVFITRNTSPIANDMTLRVTPQALLLTENDPVDKPTLAMSQNGVCEKADQRIGSTGEIKALAPSPDTSEKK